MPPNPDPPAAPEVHQLEIKRLCRPKSTRFKILSLLWIFPSAGAIMILGVDAAAWIHQPGFGPRLAAVPLQSWVAVMLLAAHGLFIGLARRYHRTEPWREMVFYEPGPDPAAPGATTSL